MGNTLHFFFRKRKVFSQIVCIIARETHNQKTGDLIHALFSGGNCLQDKSVSFNMGFHKCLIIHTVPVWILYLLTGFLNDLHNLRYIRQTGRLDSYILLHCLSPSSIFF